MRIKDISLYVFIIVIIGIFSCSQDDPAEPTNIAAPDSVAFNEVYSTGNPDWIELYNYGNADVDLSGWKVFDQEENLYALPAGTNLKSKDFLILYCDDQGSGLNLPFKLSSQGEAITLQRQDGKLMDRVAFPPMDD
jgi:hypothetical protein